VLQQSGRPREGTEISFITSLVQTTVPNRHDVVLRIAADIAIHLHNFMSAIGLQLVQVHMEKHGILIVQCRKGCSLLENNHP
jgi:hypothetical protein